MYIKNADQLILGNFLVLEVILINCNMDTHDLPDMYALSPQAYISGKSLVPMHVTTVS